MTTTALLVAEIRRLKDRERDLLFALIDARKDIRAANERYDQLIQNMKNSSKVPTDVHNYIVLNLQPK